MGSKHKHNSSTLKEKLEVLKRIDKGESALCFAFAYQMLCLYGIGETLLLQAILVHCIRRSLTLSLRSHFMVSMTLTVGSLVVRASDFRPEGMGSMPPNTLQVHTEHVLAKSVGLKVLWAESRVQGTEEHFPPIVH
ncbi:hypothetical protein TNCV_2905041 [Trichonephila clavipes]|nr:hypothetical protein TNCV_2905041 [Trichonephila clavipes]